MSFRAVATMAGENWPADFNNDGITDLVGRNNSSGAIQVVLGNGDGWRTIGSITVSMPTRIYVGLPVTSHNNATLTEANFDEVSFRKKESPAHGVRVR